MCALLIGNVATTFSEFAGIASGMGLFGRAYLGKRAYFRRDCVAARGEGKL